MNLLLRGGQLTVGYDTGVNHPPMPLGQLLRAANVGPKSPYCFSYSVNALVLTAAGICRFEGFPRPRCTSPWSP